MFIEREMLLNFKHPGIVQLFSTFQKPDKLYFVLEYLEGGDLADFLKLHRSIYLILLKKILNMKHFNFIWQK